jgi:hypothetical protein
MNWKRGALELEDKIESNLQTFAGLVSRQEYDWPLINEIDQDIQGLIQQLNQLLKTANDAKANDYSRHLADYNREYNRIKVFYSFNIIEFIKSRYSFYSTLAKEREDLMSSIQKDIK